MNPRPSQQQVLRHRHVYNLKINVEPSRPYLQAQTNFPNSGPLGTIESFDVDGPVLDLMQPLSQRSECYQWTNIEAGPSINQDPSDKIIFALHSDVQRFVVTQPFWWHLIFMISDLMTFQYLPYHVFHFSSGDVAW